MADLDRRALLRAARLYLVCDARPGGHEPGAFLAAALRGGVDVVQLRDKGLGDDALLAAARAFRAACDAAGALFVLNDRPDLVAAAGADGVHVGQDDMPVADARALVGADRIVGLSTHTPEQVAAGAGADYIGVGPVHATPTKPGRPAVGTALIGHAARHAAVPWFAIGGIGRDTLDPVLSAGARRVAVVRALTGASDPEAEARALREALAHAGARADAA
ncbi:MAG: thiamine phosphate synthase [Solirubrobacteraceae bacterium]